MKSFLSVLPDLKRFAAAIALFSAFLFESSPALRADPVPVVHREGTEHGFLVVRTPEGKELAAGDITQVVSGDRVTIRLIYRFKDGSLDDEKTVFLQRKVFSLISDRHVQKGPAFEHPSDVFIDVPTGTLTVRTLGPGKENVESTHMEFPPDIANGMELTILKNVSSKAPETDVSFLAADPKPRIVKLSLRPAGDDPFTVAGFRHTATHYVVKVELGGVTGLVAPLIGKQPKDIDVWVVGGPAPAFVKCEGPFAVFGPVWTIELSSPVWPTRSSK